MLNDVLAQPGWSREQRQMVIAGRPRDGGGEAENRGK